jgi:hypothetical protein
MAKAYFTPVGNCADSRRLARRWAPGVAMPHAAHHPPPERGGGRGP